MSLVRSGRTNLFVYSAFARRRWSRVCRLRGSCLGNLDFSSVSVVFKKAAVILRVTPYPFVPDPVNTERCAVAGASIFVNNTVQHVRLSRPIYRPLRYPLKFYTVYSNEGERGKIAGWRENVYFALSELAELPSSP